jgi:dGTPase
MAVKAVRIIQNLYEAFTKEPTTLPENFQSDVNDIGLEKTVCFYIAGMTDRYAINEHQKLFDPEILP